MADEDPYVIAYDEAVRLIAGQESALDSLRSRGATLLTLASLATALLGTQALKSKHAFSHPWPWLAIGAFAGLALLTIFVLLPYRWEGLYLSPKRIIADYADDDPPASVAEMHKDLAVHIEDNFDENDVQMRRLFIAFRVACGLVAVEVILWIVELAR